MCWYLSSHFPCFCCFFKQANKHATVNKYNECFADNQTLPDNLFGIANYFSEILRDDAALAVETAATSKAGKKPKNIKPRKVRTPAEICEVVLARMAAFSSGESRLLFKQAVSLFHRLLLATDRTTQDEKYVVVEALQALQAMDAVKIAATMAGTSSDSEALSNEVASEVAAAEPKRVNSGAFIVTSDALIGRTSVLIGRTQANHVCMMTMHWAQWIWQGCRPKKKMAEWWRSFDNIDEEVMDVLAQDLDLLDQVRTLVTEDHVFDCDLARVHVALLALGRTSSSKTKSASYWNYRDSFAELIRTISPAAEMFVAGGDKKGNKYESRDEFEAREAAVEIAKAKAAEAKAKADKDKAKADKQAQKDELKNEAERKAAEEAEDKLAKEIEEAEKKTQEAVAALAVVKAKNRENALLQAKQLKEKKATAEKQAKKAADVEADADIEDAESSQNDDDDHDREFDFDDEFYFGADEPEGTDVAKELTYGTRRSSSVSSDLQTTSSTATNLQDGIEVELNANDPSVLHEKAKHPFHSRAPKYLFIRDMPMDIDALITFIRLSFASCDEAELSYVFIELPTAGHHDIILGLCKSGGGESKPQVFTYLHTINAETGCAAGTSVAVFGFGPELSPQLRKREHDRLARGLQQSLTGTGPNTFAYPKEYAARRKDAGDALFYLHILGMYVPKRDAKITVAVLEKKPLISLAVIALNRTKLSVCTGTEDVTKHAHPLLLCMCCGSYYLN